MSTANDTQIGGKHYRSKIQHWDYVIANGLDYFQGQITKYVSRWKQKNGIEDLLKAKHFLDKYIELATEQDIKGEAEQKRWLEQVAADERVNDAEARLTYLLQHFVYSGDGEFTFPDGETYGCAKVAKHTDDVVMRHQSNARYNMEGMKENHVMYRCRLCREHFHIPFTSRPEDGHTQCAALGDSPLENGDAYAAPLEDMVENRLEAHHTAPIDNGPVPV